MKCFIPPGMNGHSISNLLLMQASSKEVVGHRSALCAHQKSLSERDAMRAWGTPLSQRQMPLLRCRPRRRLLDALP